MSETKTPNYSEMNVHEKILEVMKIVSYLQKTSDVAGQYKAVPIQQVVSAVRAACIQVGIVIVPVQSRAEVRHLPKFHIKKNSEGKIWKEADAFRTELLLTLEVVNVTCPSQFFRFEVFGAGMDEADKDPGKAFSYAYKNGIMKLFQIETGESEQSPYGAPPEVETIDGKQLEKIRALAEEAKLSEEKLCQSVDVERLEDMPLDKFEESCKALLLRIERIKEKQAGKKKPEATATPPVN
jgi:hypothetical protein